MKTNTAEGRADAGLFGGFRGHLIPPFNDKSKCHWVSHIFTARVIIWIPLFVALSATPQVWHPNGPPNVVQSEFITTNGVTTFRLVGLLPGGFCCQRIAAYDASRQGSQLFEILQQELWGGACIMWLCPDWTEEVISPLGALPPGDYTLNLFASSSFNPWGSPVLWASLPFFVPTNRPAINFSNSTRTNNTMLLIELPVLTNTLYVLESSPNLTTWNATKTNHGAPFVFSEPISAAGSRFYRVSFRPESNPASP